MINKIKILIFSLIFSKSIHAQDIVCITYLMFRNPINKKL